MINAAAATVQLVQRLRARVAAGRAASLRLQRRSGIDWHSATDLWPEFTADNSRS